LMFGLWGDSYHKMQIRANFSDLVGNMNLPTAFALI
jgi:hypothetical protein